MKAFKKTLSILLALLIAFTCASVAFAAKDILVFVTVDGIKKTLYDSELTVRAGSSVLDVLKAAGLDVVVQQTEDGARIVSIEGDTEKTFGGSDGWYYDLWPEETYCSTPVDKKQVENGDCIEVYYADRAVGFQKPIFHEQLNEGFIYLYSNETDPATGEETQVPVVGATMVIDGTHTFVSDENGKVYLPAELCENVHTMTLERYAENDLPTLLRAEGEIGFDPTLGPNLPVGSFLIRLGNWFGSIIDRIVAFFKGLFK